MRTAVITLLALGGMIASSDVEAAEGRVVTSERGTCIEGPHELLRVRRLPGTAVFSAKPQNPMQDAYVHCEEPDRDGSRAASGVEGRRR